MLPDIVTPVSEFTVYEYVNGDVPPVVMLVNNTLCPASIVCVVGEIDIDGAVSIVITELDEWVTYPVWSVIVSRTLYVPGFENVIVLPDMVTPDSELTVYEYVNGPVPNEVVLVNVTD